MTPKEVDVFTHGCGYSSALQPKVLEWPQLNIVYQGKNIKNSSISKAVICTEHEIEESQSDMKILDYKMDFYKALNLCYILGGNMPLPKRTGSLIFENILSHLSPYCNGQFWIPIVQSEKTNRIWVNAHNVDNQQEVTDLHWAYGQPNGEPTLLVSAVV